MADTRPEVVRLLMALRARDPQDPATWRVDERGKRRQLTPGELAMLGEATGEERSTALAALGRRMSLIRTVGVHQAEAELIGRVREVVALVEAREPVVARMRVFLARDEDLEGADAEEWAGLVVEVERLNTALARAERALAERRTVFEGGGCGR